ncbi:MAG TPA: AI-2E family transporter [Roseiflexaceae bacterium]|nr:AI-2E family transporter [Roseiflexaceae bacterium]
MSTDRLQRVLIWMLIIAAALFLLERLFVLFSLFSSPLLLFGLAWLIALALRPLVDRITSLELPFPPVGRWARKPGVALPTWKLPRAAAVALIYLLVLAVAIITIISLVPLVGPQLVGIQVALPDAVGEVTRWSVQLEQELQRYGVRADVQSILRPEALVQQATVLGSTLVQQSVSLVGSLAVVVVDLILVLILSFYMTMDGPRLAARVLELMPRDWRDETRVLFEIVDRTFGGFLRAQIVQSLIYGLATAVLMAIMGLSDVALASLIAGLMVLIPIIGGVLAMIPPLLLALIQAPDRFLLTLVLLLVLQQVLFNMVMPRIMGQIVGLHPLLVFAALLVGATLAGTWGVLFGIPIAGVLASVFQFLYVRARRQYAIESGQAAD